MLAAFLRSMAAQRTALGADVAYDLAFVDDNEDAESSELLRSSGAVVLPPEERAADALYAIGSDSHHWNERAFEHLARQKQRLISHAQQHHYTHIFFADSDLIMEPSTLRVLLADGVDIANGVFWTHWTPQAPPLPQCWLAQPYGLAGLGMEEGAFLDALSERQLVRVMGGGACVLMKLDALTTVPGRHVRYWPRLGRELPQEGMWQGEDRTLAVLAERNRIRQYADGWPDIFHAYHPEQRGAEILAEVEELIHAPTQTQAGYGDLILVKMTSLTDKGLQDVMLPEVRSVRGRLGALRLLPEVEIALLDMTVGSQRIVETHYPPHWPLPIYAGKEGLVMLELVDAKPMGYAPVLADIMFKALERSGR